MRFKSYERFHYLTTVDRPTMDAQQNLVAVLHTSGWSMLKWISMQN